MMRFRPYTALARCAQIQPIKVDFDRSKIIFHTSNHQETIIRESLKTISNKKIFRDVLPNGIHAVWKKLTHYT